MRLPTFRGLLLPAGAAILVTCGAASAGVSRGAQAATNSRASQGRARSPAGGGGFLLRPAPDARGCTPPRDLPNRPAPGSIAQRLKVLRLPRTSIDGVPVLNRPDGKSSSDTGWLAVTSIDYRGVRRRRGPAPAVYVIPSAGVIKLSGERVGAPCPAALPAPVAPGACLVTGPPGGPFSVGCWTLTEIDLGRAFALVGVGRTETLVGLVPSGATVVLATRFGRGVTLRSPDGVVDQPTRLAVGTRLLARVTR